MAEQEGETLEGLGIEVVVVVVVGGVLRDGGRLLEDVGWRVKANVSVGDAWVAVASGWALIAVLRGGAHVDGAEAEVEVMDVVFVIVVVLVGHAEVSVAVVGVGHAGRVDAGVLEEEQRWEDVSLGVGTSKFEQGHGTHLLILW